MSSKIEMKKLGVRFRPPTIFLFYLDTKTSKLRRRTIALTDFTQDTNLNDYAKDLHKNSKAVHRDLFQLVPLRRLERILFVLKEGMKFGTSKSEIEKKLLKFDELDVDEDLNKLDDDTLRHKKLIMSESYEKNLVDPSSKDFVYDVSVDFEQPTDEKQQASEWDSGEEDEVDDDEDDFK